MRMLQTCWLYFTSSKRDEQAGYMLLEVLIATTIAASVVSLLLTALTGLGKAQTRIGTSTELLSEQVFEEALLSELFDNTFPPYHDDEVQFLGEKTRVSMRTFMDSYDGKGKVFSLSLVSSNGEGTDLVLQLDTELHVITQLPKGNYSFGYIDHFGNTQLEWDTLADQLVDKKLAHSNPHVSMIPRGFQILRIQGSKSEILLSYNIPHTVFPPRRPEDLVLYIGRL